MLKTLRGYFFWTYERGSFHYDVMVTLILLFIFVSPHYIDYKDKPVTDIPLRDSEVSVKEAGTVDGAHQFLYQLRADQIDTPNSSQSDTDRRAAILRIIEPIAGEVTLERYEPIKNTRGQVIAYNAWVLR